MRLYASLPTVLTKLQQCLLFTVLKHGVIRQHLQIILWIVATVLTVYGIETNWNSLAFVKISKCCNSTYRLRY